MIVRSVTFSIYDSMRLSNSLHFEMRARSRRALSSAAAAAATAVANVEGFVLCHFIMLPATLVDAMTPRFRRASASANITLINPNSIASHLSSKASTRARLHTRNDRNVRCIIRSRDMNRLIYIGEKPRTVLALRTATKKDSMRLAETFCFHR